MNDDLISREWLEDAFDNLCCHNCKMCRNFRIEDSFYKCALIDNAPTIERIVCRSRDWSNECTHSSSFEQGYTQGYHCGFAKGAEIPSFRKTGKWINTGKTWEETVDGFIHSGNIYECSVCKAEIKGHIECKPFCEYCGAYMRGKEE